MLDGCLSVAGVLKGIPVGELMTPDQVALVAHAQESPLGKAVIQSCRGYGALRFNQALRNPQLNTERMIDDFRAQYGLYVGLGFVDELVRVCSREVAR